SRATGKATSASSRATRTSRRASSTSFSDSRPRPLRRSKTPVSRSLKASNIRLSPVAPSQTPIDPVDDHVDGGPRRPRPTEIGVVEVEGAFRLRRKSGCMLRKPASGQGWAVAAGLDRRCRLSSVFRRADASRQGSKEFGLERRLLQLSVAIAGLAPVAGGMGGVLWGAAALGEQAQGAFDSHFRYLSGLLAAIGVAYWTAIPEIEAEGAKFALLTIIVVAGGFSRALGMLIAGPPGAAMSAA